MMRKKEVFAFEPSYMSSDVITYQQKHLWRFKLVFPDILVTSPTVLPVLVHHFTKTEQCPKLEKMGVISLPMVRSPPDVVWWVQ